MPVLGAIPVAPMRRGKGPLATLSGPSAEPILNMIRSPGRARSTLCLVSAIIVTKRGDLLMSAIFRAYNDWLAEFCRTDPARLKGIAMINLDDVEDGIRELERAARLG